MRRSDAALDTPAVRRDIARCEEALDRLAAPLDPGDPVAAGAELDRRSVADFLDELRLEPAARMVVEHWLIRDQFCVEAGELSLLALAQVCSYDAGAAEAFRVQGQRPDRARAGERAGPPRGPERAPVEAIVDDGRLLHVTARGRTYTAQRCIVAAPLPALRAVRFSPDPPRAVAEAIASLAYGRGGKVAFAARGASGVRRGSTVTSSPTCRSTWPGTPPTPCRETAASCCRSPSGRRAGLGPRSTLPAGSPGPSPTRMPSIRAPGTR